MVQASAVLAVTFTLGAPAAEGAGRPDLEVATVARPPATVAPGGQLAVAHRVINAGRRAAGSSVVGFFLSRDTTRGRDDVRLSGTRRVRRLASRKGSTARTRLVVPAATPAGSYFLLVCADDARRIREASERDNCRVAAGRLTVTASLAAPVAPAPPAPAPPAPAGTSTPPGPVPPPGPPTPPDDDGDGIADASDNCSGLANAGQENADGDGLGDACDADDDNDALADGTDNCSGVANPGQENVDGDALGDACDPDDDNDGHADAQDCAPYDAALPEDPYTKCYAAATAMDVNTGTVPVGEEVVIDGLVVTAVKANPSHGAWVRDGVPSQPYAALELNGPLPGAAAAGTVLVVRGTVATGGTIVADEILATGSGMEPAPVPIQASELSIGAFAQPVNNDLVQIGPSEVSTSETAGFMTTDGVFVAKRAYGFASPAPGTCYGPITGIAEIGGAAPELQPRSSADLAVMPC